MRRRAQEALARRSGWLFGFFAWIFARSLRQDFHAIRLAKAVAPPSATTPCLVLYSNHPSWWDAVIYIHLAREYFPDRVFRAPIDAAMIARYAFMEKIGTFGVEQGTRRGALDFLTASKLILADPRNILMITAQGRFADIRERPLRLEPGLAHLADVDQQISFVPFAIEYCFWTERQPELLVRFGEAIAASALSDLGVPERTLRLESALETTMDALAADAIARDESAFTVILAGKTGVHPLYDFWRRVLAMLRGQRFDPQHGSAK